MEHEHFFTMMMDALDGELAAGSHAELESHLRACPACMREWQAIVAIDTLFRQTPALSPAADFAQRTLARLPNRRVRLWAISLIYAFLLLSGILPILLVIWAVNNLGPVISEPALVNSFIQLVDKALTVTGTVLRALWSGLGEFVQQQPTVLGWLLVMVGVVFLWNGVYRQLLNNPNRL
jgi:anti-sigma factor RsiW